MCSNKIVLHACSFVKFKTPLAALSGTWDPYPIAMEFKPPCMVLSTIGFGGYGKIGATDVDACPKHLHQLHVCMPSSRGKTRLLYRMGLDWWPFMKHVPFIYIFWQHLANQVYYHLCIQYDCRDVNDRINHCCHKFFNGLTSLCSLVTTLGSS